MTVSKSVEYTVFMQDLTLNKRLTKKVESYLRIVSPSEYSIEGYGGVTQQIAVTEIDSREEAEAIQRGLDAIINS